MKDEDIRPVAYWLWQQSQIGNLIYPTDTSPESPEKYWFQAIALIKNEANREP